MAKKMEIIHLFLLHVSRSMLPSSRYAKDIILLFSAWTWLYGPVLSSKFEWAKFDQQFSGLTALFGKLGNISKNNPAVCGLS